MSDIKSVVSLLSKIINTYFQINLRAEHFRLAKYNKEDENIVPLFWHLLHTSSNIKNNNDIVLQTKLHFACLGYKNIEFYCLPEDMTGGSRELLLAFSWLLQKEKILDDVLKKELENSEINTDFSLSFYENHSSENIPKLDSIEDIYNNILWISGRINNNLKQISEIKMRSLQLTNKVHIESMLNKRSCQLSVNELILLKNQDALKNYLLRIEKVTHMLDYYKRWKLKESFYWEWMQTVINEKEKNMIAINTDTLENFFVELRKYAKKLLIKKEASQKGVPTLENQFPRCIYAPKSETPSLIPNLNKNSTTRQENNLSEIAKFLGIYCKKPAI